LNESSMLLEALRSSSAGAPDAPPARVRLNVAACTTLLAFPGQLVGVLGRCSASGTVFHARDFTAGLPVPAPKATPAAAAAAAAAEAAAEAASADEKAAERLHLAVLAGPFCLRDTLDFKPLESALERAAAARPQALVLLGPFLDAGNQKVAAGDATLPADGEGGEPCDFEELYSRHVLPTLQRTLVGLRRKSPDTQILLVPSLEDVLCFHPLPQPPLDAMLAPVLGAQALGQLKSAVPGLRFLPNPAHVRLGSTVVTLCASDALSPVLRSGLVLRPEEKKIEAALRALVHQRCLFPVLPRDPPQVSEIRASALDFPDHTAPDVCIFPSQAGLPSATLVGETAFLNPGAVCRPASLGSFAEVRLAPATGSGGAASFQERLQVEIHKLA